MSAGEPKFGCGCFSRSAIREDSSNVKERRVTIPALLSRSAAPEDSSKANKGRVMVPILKRLVSYHTTKLSSKSPSAGVREHVKYNIDFDEVAEFFKEWTKSKSKSFFGRRSRSRRDDESLTSDDDSDDGALPIPAYEDGQEAEYFSNTYQRWLPCVVHVNVGQPDHSSNTTISYSITLSHGGQQKAAVLALLRPRLKADELIELFSGRQGGTRLPAKIVDSHLPTSTKLGYRVKVDDTEEEFDQVPSLRLKRRYPRNQQIQIYLGERLGWQSAFVHHAAALDGCGEEVVFPNGIDQKSSPSPDHVEFKASAIGLWSLIPVCAELSQVNDPPEWVPSYLIR
eukprot:CAMPEP_0169137286 /NCGR_PEP_ID=MMETSP1015-20121227/41445_1 /TAXON_ID=342587 /ORGANISM="Karlodinium micrum, Strain CCMP2283" /LENGTH=340 /DNA_ID=CAMNT_0009202095 /DNA_START=46 /DNA_END=1068 /DNA_ORIENTATION=+